MNGAGGASHQTDRIDAVHAGLGYLITAQPGTVAQKAWVAVMQGHAGAYALIAADAAFQVDEHGGGAVDEVMLHQPFDQLAMHALPAASEHG